MAILWILFGLPCVVLSQTTVAAGDTTSLGSVSSSQRPTYLAPTSPSPGADNSSLGSTTPTSQRPTYRVVTVQSEPWVMRWANGSYHGLIVDLLDGVAGLADFTYTMYESPDGQYGSLDYTTGTFNGLVGELQYERADIAAADLTVTEARAKWVAFSAPFYETGAQILLQRPVTSPLDFRLLATPFTVEAWCVFLAAFVVTAGLMAASDRIWARHGRDMKTANGSESWTGSCYDGRGRGNPPPSRPCSAKLLTALLWFLTAATLALYTANLTCRLTAARANHGKLPFKTFHHMAEQSRVSYGGWFGMRLSPLDPLQIRMDRFISSKHTYFSTMDEAVSRIRSTNGRFAAIVDGYHGKDVVNENCDLILLSEQLFSIYCSFACRRTDQGTELCSNITQALVKLREDGTLYSRLQFWFDKYSISKCDSATEDDFESQDGRPEVPFAAMSLRETAPVFGLVLCGLVLAVVIMIAELIQNRSKTKNQSDISTEESHLPKYEQSFTDGKHPSRTPSNLSTPVISDEKIY